MSDVFTTWPPEFLEVLGVLGFGVYVLNYSLLTLRKLDSEHIMYFCLNCLAAGLVLTSLIQAFNLASALIQVFWIGISTIGIITRMRLNRSRRGPELAAPTELHAAE